MLKMMDVGLIIASNLDNEQQTSRFDPHVLL